MPSGKIKRCQNCVLLKRACGGSPCDHCSNNKFRCIVSREKLTKLDRLPSNKKRGRPRKVIQEEPQRSVDLTQNILPGKPYQIKLPSNTNQAFDLTQKKFQKISPEELQNIPLEKNYYINPPSSVNQSFNIFSTLCKCYICMDSFSILRDTYRMVDKRYNI